MRNLLFVICLFLLVGCRQEPQEVPMVDPPVTPVPSVVKEPIVTPTPAPPKKHRLFHRLRLRQVPLQAPVL